MTKRLEKKTNKKIMTKAGFCLFVVTIILFSLMLTISFSSFNWFNSNNTIEDWSYLDENSISGYKNGSYINNGEYISNDIIGVNNIQKVDASKSEAGGTSTAAVTISTLTNSYSFDSTTFATDTNVTWGEYSSANWDGRINCGTGYFGYKKGDATGRQAKIQNTAYTNIRISGDMLTLVKNGKLAFTLSGKYCAESGDNQTMAYGVIVSNSLKSAQAFSTIDSFRNAMTVASGSLSTTDSGSWDFDNIAYNFSSNSWTDCYITICVSSFSEYGSFIGGRCPSGYLSNLKLSFTLRQNYTVTFGRNNSGGTITSSSGTISKVADVLTSTASEGDGYLWTKWAIGSESGAQKTTAKALSINVINCLSDGTTYTAVFTAITYTITFSQNGKSGSPPASITVSGAAATSALPSSSSPDLIFAGWMLASNKSSPDYYVGGTFYPYTLNGTKTASITITLYALWQAAKPTYGGELTEENVSISPSSYTMYEDLTFTITAEKTGHSLASVYAKYDKGELTGTKVALEGSGQYWTLYGVCGDFTLSAEWKANTYTISYYVGTTKVSPGSSNSYWTIPSGAPTTGIYGTKINFRSFLPSCSNADYTFKGWTTTNGGSTYLGEQTITSNINAYLRYESSAIDGSYNSGWTASSGSAPSSTNNGDGKSGFGWAKKSNGDHDDSYYSYKTINFSSISDLHNYGAKTVDVTIGYACYARCYSTAFDSLSNTAYFYGGLSTSSVSSYSSVSKKSSKSVTATGTSQQQNVGTVNYSLSGITTSGFKIWFGARLVIDDAKWNCYPATYITSVTYKITTSANTSYTVTLNMNDSSTSISTKLLSGASLQLPYTTITKTGYSFKGWSTSSTANSASVLPGGAINVSSSATYYAVWEKKNYPIISYDVFTDGISYCTSIRKEWYRAYNESVTLNGTNQSSSSYSGANMYPKGGGNTDDYVGFTPNGGYNVTNRNGKSSNKWGYIAGTSASTITLTQAKWAYYIWQMDDPTSTKTDSTVIYGTSVNLESLVITDHGDDNAICSVGTWKVNDVAKVFYITGEPIIYAVDESATYSYTITATLTRSSSTTGATVTLTKSKISSQGTNPSVTINPIKLKLNAPTVSTLAYTGSEQEFLFTTTVDNESHTGSEYTNCVSVFNRERDLGTGQPYYYNSGGNNSGYWAGVTTYLVGTGYRSNIGEYYTQGSVVFKDAGTYWVNNIQIRRYIGVRQGEANTNYVWKTNDSQALSADTQNSSGTVTATITPKNGFDIYAFYTYKTFGQVSDPTKIAINMDDEDYDDKLSNGDYEQTDWYLGITGLYVVDFTEFSSTILGGLVRDTSDTLNNAAGLYDVTLTLNSTSFPPRLINNYGCQVSSANYTYLSTSTINMYFYNNSYTKMSNTGYNFTSSTLWTGYSQSHNNYEIKPREVSMSIGQYAATTYDGNSHGITMTVNGSDLLTTEEQTALISVSQNYNKYLEVYFYGIPMPANWSSIENKEQYIEDNSNSKQIVGIKETNEETRRYVKNAQKNQLDFKEINAGGYGVLIIGTAYSTDGGTTFAENPDYKLPSYFSFSWEIKKLIVAPTTSETSATFGDINYGGTGFTFSNIVAGDSINCTVSTTYNGNSSTGFIRYQGLTSSTAISNGTYRNYGTHIGTYVTTISNPTTVGSTASSGMYGSSYGNNYEFSSSYTSTLAITYRTINKSIAYTIDGGTNSSASKQNGTYDWTYQYNIQKGIIVTFTNFYQENFISSDVSYYDGKTAEEQAKILIRSSVFLNAGSIEATSGGKTISSGVINTNPVATSTAGTGSNTYNFYAINAGSYTIAFTTDPFAYRYNGVLYGNYHLNSAINESFTINQKVIKLTWTLDGNNVESVNPALTYNNVSHTVAATFIRGTNGSTTANDFNVYYSDYVSATSLYTRFSALNQASIAYTGITTATNANTYTAYVTQLTGNYTISTDTSEPSSRELTWIINRRTFTMSVANPNQIFLYDGTEKTVPLTLNGNGVAVTIDEFTASMAGANFTHVGLTFNASTKTFGATNVGRYEFSYNAGAGIDVETNWRLTGSASYTYLFVIRPQVIVLSWNTTSATYTGSNIISSFYPVFNTAIATTGLTLTYDKNSIIHAGSYTINVTGKSGNDNFVLASSSLNGWYTDAETYNSSIVNYYKSNSAAETTYSKTVTVNRYVVTLNTSALNSALQNYVYDGQTHGFNLSTFYDVIKEDLLTAADKAGYSLNGTSATGKNVGNYAVTITGFNAYAGYTDYDLSEAYNNTWSITAKPLTVVYTEYHSAGSTYDYDGNEHGYRLALSGLVTGESLKLYFSRTNVVVRGMDGVISPDDDNDLTISAGGYVTLFGVNALAYSIGMLSIGNKTVQVDEESITYLAANYSLPGTGTNKEWTIVQRTITVTWNNTSLTYRASEYNTSNGGVYATVTNLVTGDTFSITYGGTSRAVNVGSYNVSISDLTGGDYANYKIVGTLSTSWSITAKTVSLVSWAGDGFAGLSVVYDGASHRVLATPTTGATAANDGKIYTSDSASFAFNYSSTSPYVTTAIVVGTYNSQITGCNNPNYTVSAGQSAQTEWSITTRTITATITYDDSTNTHQYDASTHGLTITLSNFIATDWTENNIRFTFTSTAQSDNGGNLVNSTSYGRIFRSTSFGSYSISVSIDGTKSRASCYTLSGTTSGSFSITKRPVTLSWSLSGSANFSVVYDGTSHVMSATVTNLADENDTVNITVSNGTQTNFGSYTATASAVSNTNYTLTGGTNLTQGYNITARAISATWTTSDYTYNGQYQGNGLTIYNLIAADSLTFTINFYTGGYSGTNIKTAEITKTGNTTASFTPAEFAATVDYGTYYAILSTTIKTAGVTNSNYSFTPSADSDRTSYDIARKTLTLSGTWTWSNSGNSGTYNNETYLIYNKAQYTLTTSIANGVAATRLGVLDSLSLTYSGNTATHVSDGETATVSGITGTYANNYVLPSSRTRTYVINPKEVTVVWSNYTGIVYDGNNHSITATIASGATTSTDGKAYTGDTVTVTSLTNAEKKNAGTYTAIATALSNDDYIIGTGTYASGNASRQYTIAQRPISLSWSAENIEYDGTEKTVTATITNLVTGDIVTLAYTNNAKTSVGDYTATVSSISGTSSANYTLTGGTNLSNVWHITPIELGFSWSGGANLVYNKSAQGMLLTITKIAAADLNNLSKLTFTTQAGVTANHTQSVYSISFTSINAGTYTANVTGISGTSASNYSLPNVSSNTFTIQRRAITVSWTSSNQTYNSSSYSATASITNLCSEDTSSLTYRTVGNATSYNVTGAVNVGNVATHADSYTTSITAVSNNNYTIEGSTGLSTAWVISPKALTAFTYTLDGGNTFTTTYNGSAHTIAATVANNATTTSDGKMYSSDSVTLGYSGTVRTNYGVSSIANNSATFAGVYRVTISSTGNSDYSVSNQYVDFTIGKRTINVSITNVAGSTFIYNGNAQGQRVTLTNIVAGDNDNTNLIMNPTFAETVSAANRSGTTMYREFTAINAGDYSGSAVLSGSRHSNYILDDDIEIDFTISPKDISTAITVNTSTNKWTYAARSITASDLGISFTTLITGEALQNADYSVTYKNSSSETIAAPINVGSNYSATIALNNTTSANNYNLTGTTTFSFDIVEYELTPSMFTWSLGGNSVSLNNLTFVADEHKTITATVSDSVYATLNGKTLSYKYFGFCNGILNESYSQFSSDVEHAGHEWLADNQGNLRTTGPEHAGSYWVLITLSGGDAANFKLTGFTGYSDANHFTTSAGNTYLTFYQDSSNHAIANALPSLGNNVACLSFGINRAELGFETVVTPSSLPFRGTYYHAQAGELPYVTEISQGADIQVTIGSSQYTYAEYSSNSAELIKDAGVYNIKIYDANASGQTTVTGCDYFSNGAVLESYTSLTVTQSKITILDNRTDANAWKKEYDRTTAFTNFTYLTNVTFDPDEVTDGVISGTTLTITGTFSDYNSGNNRPITFTFGGADAGNYYAVFETSESTIDSQDVTVVGNTYTIDGSIYQRVIEVVSSATKVYDGTNALVPFSITSMNIVPGDTVTVTGTFESANVGTWDIIISSGNANYRISSNIEATGIIQPKPLTLNWSNTGNVTYDKQAHGVSVTVVGMVENHEETLTVTGTNIANTTIAAGTSFAQYTAVNANTYAVSISLGNSSNYTLTSATTYQEWTIAQRVLGITWNKDEYEWDGSSTVYSAIERTITPTITSNLVSGDVVGLTVINNVYTAVVSLTAEITGLTGADSANYTLPANPTYAWSITPATITGVSISNVNAVYNAAAQGPEINKYVTQHNIAINAVYSGGDLQTTNTIVGNNARRNVGSSNITVTLTAPNYNNLVLNATVTITKATVTGVVLSNVNTTYDSTSKSVTVNRTTTQFSENITVTYTISTDGETYVSGNSKTNAGSYYVRATCTAGNNYNDFVLNASLVINKADILASRINVNIDSGTVTYNASYHGVTITVTDNETQFGEPVTINYYGGETGGQAKNVGVYNINAVVSAGANYNNFTTDSTTLTIQPKEITISYQEGTFTYTGFVQTPTVTITSGICVADEGNILLTVGVLGTSGEANGDTIFKDAGNYTITPSLNSINYSIPALSSSRAYTINQATITGYYFVGNTVSYNGQIRYLGVNDDNTAYMNNVTSVSLLASDEGAVTYKYNTTGINDAYSTTFNGVKYAGTYYIQATINGGGNYITWTQKAQLQINIVNLSGYSLIDLITTYDGSVKTLSVTLDNPSLYNAGVYTTAQGDVLTLTYTISSDGGENYTSGNSATNAGHYDIRLVFSVPAEATSSYVSASLTKEADLTINKAILSGMSFNGGNYEYDGEAHNVVPTMPVVVEGVYPQYTLNQAGTVLTVKLSASHNSGNGDTFTVTQTVDQGVSAINVGSYNFRLGITPLSANSNNYETFAGLTSTVNITPTTMKTSAGVNLVQGTNIFFAGGAIEFTYDALYHYIVIATTREASILTTNVNNLVTSYTVYATTSHSDQTEVIYAVNSVAANGVHDVGVFTVTATLSNSNYVPLILSASVTVNKANINYYFVGKTDLIYDTQTHFAAVNNTNAYLNDGTVTQISLEGSDLATVAYTYTSTRNGSGAFGGARNADTYNITATITVTGGAAGNYNYWDQVNEDNNLSAQIIISPYETAITWVNETAQFTYNGEASSIIGASFIAANSNTQQMVINYLGISGKATGDTIFKNAGTYTVTAVYDSDAPYNYSFTTTDTKTVVMQKANVDVYLVNASITYDSVVHYLVVNTVNASLVSTSNVVSVNPYASDIIPINYTYAKAGGTYDSYYNGENVVSLTLGAKNAGTYTVTADIDLGEGESNYNDWANPKSATLTINKINLSQEGGVFTKTYDGTVTISNIGTISGIVLADSTYLTIGGTFDNKNVGTNKQIVFTIEAEENYEYLINNYIVPTSIRGTINQKALTVSTTLDDWDKPYDGTTSSPLNPLNITTSNGLINGDSITVNAQYNSKNVLVANTISFTISGTDAANYSLASLDFSETVDFDTVYLITPLSADINWSTNVSDFNGNNQVISASVDVYGEDAIGTDGRLALTLSITRTHDGNGTALNPVENNATYRNAGTYAVTATSGALDANFIANYGITSTNNTYTINKAYRGVNWSNLANTYTYNGQNQGASITASVTLLGTDVTTYAQTNYLTIDITKNSEAVIFKDAGDYELTARLTVAELNNNYTLSNQYFERTIIKANINNIDFNGSYTWTYYSGVTDYFFVVAAGGTFARYESGEFNITTSYNYPYDAVAMPILYAGGEFSHANVNGLNGIKNAGSYTISASVAANNNYNAWEGAITVTVNKGTIDNIVIGDVSQIFNGVNYYLYAYNGSVGDEEVGQTTFTEITTPDGEVVNIEYQISISSYAYNGYIVAYNHNYNYAYNAGTYSVGAFITNHRNYVNFEAPNVNSTKNMGAILYIAQRDTTITWEYNNEAEPNFTYNAQNQLSTVRARILRVEGNVRDFYLTVTTQLTDNIDINNALKTVFVVAGNYLFTAAVPNSTAAEQEEYPVLMNNYNILNTTSNVEMQKFIVSIIWKYAANHSGGDPEVYDIENPCVYDKTTHGVTATGLGLNDVEMDIVTSGVFSAINAGNYTATVDRIAEGTDALILNAVTYYLPYDLNYELTDNILNWEVARRVVSVTFNNQNTLSKIYDGSTAFNYSLTSTQTQNEAGNKTIKITWRYDTTNEKVNNANSFIEYSIGNIIIADYQEQNDIEYPISSITSGIENVNTFSATIILDPFVLNRNYLITNDLTSTVVDCEITQRYIKIVFDENASHVYNGETLDVEYVYADGISARIDGLFSFENAQGNIISSLITKNAIVGTIDIDGETAVGTYDINYDLSIVDHNSVENYDVHFVDGDYEIKARNLAINYTNTLQSLNQAFVSIGYSVDTENSDLTDLDWEGMGEDPEEYLSTLLTTDAFSITISNAWKSEVYTHYTAVYGGSDSETLATTPSSSNYTINYPILQITYLRVVGDYSFTVTNLDDLRHLDSDNAGLLYAYTYNEIGSLPTFTQTANITGLVNKGIVAIESIRSFRGTYVGGNYEISNLMIKANSESNIGLFASIIEGSVSNLTLKDISVYAGSGISSIGGLAGLVNEGVTINNVVIHINMFAIADFRDYVNTPVSIGGLVGKSSGTITNATVVGKIDVKVTRFDEFNFGGVVGYMEGGSITNANAFVDSSVRSLISLASNYYTGTIVGKVGDNLEEEIETFTYLAYSNYTYDDVASSAQLTNSAFGNINSTTEAKNYDTIISNVTIKNILDNYVLRSYLFATGSLGTTASPIVMTNYRQISLMLAYPYLAFRVNANINSPIILTTVHRGFFGTITYASNTSIKARIPSNINLMDAVKDTWIVIIKRED